MEVLGQLRIKGRDVNPRLDRDQTWLDDSDSDYKSDGSGDDEDSSVNSADWMSSSDDEDETDSLFDGDDDQGATEDSLSAKKEQSDDGSPEDEQRDLEKVKDAINDDVHTSGEDNSEVFTPASKAEST